MNKIPHSPERKTGVLSLREQAVLALMAQGLSNRTIARQLLIKREAVDNHISSLFSKLGANEEDDLEKKPRSKAVLQYIAEHPDFHNPLRDHQPLKPFSGREKEVLVLVGQGLSNQEISQRLFIVQKTLGRHINSILVKLGVDHEKQSPRIMMVLAAKAMQ